MTTPPPAESPRTGPPLSRRQFATAGAGGLAAGLALTRSATARPAGSRLPQKDIDPFLLVAKTGAKDRPPPELIKFLLDLHKRRKDAGEPDQDSDMYRIKLITTLLNAASALEEAKQNDRVVALRTAAAKWADEQLRRYTPALAGVVGSAGVGEHFGNRVKDPGTNIPRNTFLLGQLLELASAALAPARGGPKSFVPGDAGARRSVAGLAASLLAAAPGAGPEREGWIWHPEDNFATLWNYGGLERHRGPKPRPVDVWHGPDVTASALLGLWAAVRGLGLLEYESEDFPTVAEGADGRTEVLTRLRDVSIHVLLSITLACRKIPPSPDAPPETGIRVTAEGKSRELYYGFREQGTNGVQRTYYYSGLWADEGLWTDEGLWVDGGLKTDKEMSTGDEAKKKRKDRARQSYLWATSSASLCTGLCARLLRALGKADRLADSDGTAARAWYAVEPHESGEGFSVRHQDRRPGFRWASPVQLELLRAGGVSIAFGDAAVSSEAVVTECLRTLDKFLGPAGRPKKLEPVAEYKYVGPAASVLERCRRAAVAAEPGLAATATDDRLSPSKVAAHLAGRLEAQKFTLGARHWKGPDQTLALCLSAVVTGYPGGDILSELLKSDRAT